MKMLTLLVLAGALLSGLGCGPDCLSGETDDNGSCIVPTPSDAEPSTDASPISGDGCDQSGNCLEPAERLGRVMRETREQREACPAEPLEWDKQLAGMAQACTPQMVDAQNTGVCADTLGARRTAQGIPSDPAPVEITATAGSVGSILQELPNGPYTHYYLDNCSFTDVAASIARDEQGVYWVSLVFR